MTPRTVARKTWAKLEARIRIAGPHLLRKIPPGATPAALSAAETALGVALPPLLREIYAIHDGLGSHWFLSLKEMVEAWSAMNWVMDAGHLNGVRAVAYGPVRCVWWSNRWIPITDDGSGNSYCVDTDPAEGGRTGQVISFWHDDEERRVRAPDIATFLLDHLEEDEWAAAEPPVPLRN